MTAGGLLHRPRSLDEALALLAEHPEVAPVAGGTDLLVKLGHRRAERPMLSLRRIPELCGTSREGDLFRIGAAATLSELLADPFVQAKLPDLACALRWIGSVQIRNVATLGGNLCNASPAADGAPPLLCLGARVELRSVRGRRELALEDFFEGPGATARAPDELLSAILVPVPPDGERAVFLRKARVRMDIATVNLALRARLEAGRLRAVRLAAGAVAPTPQRLTRAAAALEGKGPEAVPAAAEAAAAEIAPIDDLRASAWYRRRLIRVFVERAAQEVFAS